MATVKKEFFDFVVEADKDTFYPTNAIPGITRGALHTQLVLHFKDNKNRRKISGRKLKLIGQLLKTKKKESLAGNDLYHLGKKIGIANLRAMLQLKNQE